MKIDEEMSWSEGRRIAGALMKEKDSKGKEESEVEVEGKLGDHLKILEEEWGSST